MSKQIASEFETQSLNALVAGFSFAAALSWMDLVRWTIHQVVKVQKNSGLNYALTAVITTLLSIVVYMLLSRMSQRVIKPQAPIYAVTR
jgi:tetrahydromethanopterin S-methyltransferase subunit C